MAEGDLNRSWDSLGVGEYGGLEGGRSSVCIGSDLEGEKGAKSSEGE